MEVLNSSQSLLSMFIIAKLFSRQEGWRLEHKEPHNQSSPIEFKGIVFNEMKGVFVRCVFKHLLS